MRYYAPFDGTRGSEPSMVARAREIHGARSLVGPLGTRTMAADRPGRRSALSAPGTPCRRARVRRHRCVGQLSPRVRVAGIMLPNDVTKIAGEERHLSSGYNGTRARGHEGTRDGLAMMI